MANEPMMYGGQAVIKGVMMRGPKHFAVACRRLNNEITVRVESIAFPNRAAFFRWPLIRGAMALVDAMHLGIKALMWSANVAIEDMDQEEAKQELKPGEQEKARKVTSAAINDIAIGGAMVTGLGIGVFLFIILPNIIAGLLHPGILESKAALNTVEGVLRMVFFLTYVSVVGLMPNIREVFQYHGAEHRAINTFEAGRTLEFENTRDFGTIHVRCGTNFILIVLLLSIFVFSFLPWNSVLERILMRLALLPLLAGVAYEIIRWAGKRSTVPLVRAMLAPGLMLQYITTRPPSDDQVEVALASLQAVIAREREEAAAPEGTPVPQAAAAS